MNSDYSDVYKRYLALFAEKFGDVAEGGPVRHAGRLITKLSFDEFVAKWKEWRQLEAFLRDTMSNGHTLSDAVEHQYVELCAHVLENPKDFKLL